MRYEILTFLNRWKCRLSRAATAPLLRDWITQNESALENLHDLSILDDRVPERTQELNDLYRSVIDFKSRGIGNMSDAAASKILHVLRPRLFVMWDSNIAPRFGLAYRDFAYGAFIRGMHRFALRLKDIAPDSAAGDVENYLNARLKYSIRKTLAKYLDEYNWYVAFGYQRMSH